MTIESKYPSPYELLNQFDDDLWVELILTSPHSVRLICVMLTLDIQSEKEYQNKYGKN